MNVKRILEYTREISKRNIKAVARLKQDYTRLKKDPVPYIVAEPLPSNLLEWHYVIRDLLSFMLERSSTLGSVETSDYEKRQFALKSTEFNLKSRVFNEFFPDLKQETKDNIKFKNETTNPRTHISHDTKP